ncbi:unnamed protein product [Phyllotreta striolata]|uniref:FAM193 C-terminal domain-containing protein n=1 Tax=Phyllotreta striolata TaxID=444603 RepID=A0A9N9TI81_PHYSR|nr:unnamed protein product [Phyllotreta striolata]
MLMLNAPQCDMSKFSSFIELLVKQTCRRASHEFEMGSKHSSAPLPVTAERDATGIYSLEFLKSLHDKPKENIFKLLKTMDPNNPDSVKSPNNLNWLNNSKDFSNIERKKLLDFLHKVKDMSPPKSKKWIDLHHCMHYVYRNFASVSPDPAAEVLSPFFIAEMRELVKSLLEEDESQLYLRILALLREYCIFAQWNYTKCDGEEHLITKLFYYYEAMLSAAKNLSSIFSEFEVIIYRNYSVCWIDFNTCVFIRYFFETDYVQNKISQCLKTKISPGDTPAMLGLLEDLKNLWIKEQKRIRKINDDHSLVEGTVSYFIEEAMIGNHKKVLTSNFWMERSQQEKNDLDLRRLDHHFFRLLGDPFFHPAGPILDRNGQCICEECLIAKYEFILESNEDHVNDKILKNHCRLTYCRRCQKLIDLDHFHRHINSHAVTDGSNLLVNGMKNLTELVSDKNDCMTLGNGSDELTNGESENDGECCQDGDNINGEEKPLNITSLRNTCDIHFSKPQHDPSELHCTKLAFEEFLRLRREADKNMQGSNKTIRNFIKIKKDMCGNTSISGQLVINNILKSPTSLSKKDDKENEGVKVKDLPKNSQKFDKSRMSSTFKTTVTKNGENVCKREQEPSIVCQGHAGMCEHQKETKKCDCTYCEVFGSEKFPPVASHSHKSNELRDRLRIRLHQRREKRSKDTSKNPLSTVNSVTINVNATKIKTAISKVEERVPLPSSPTNIPPAPSVKSSDSSIATSSVATSNGTDDIHGLVNYIEGNTALNKMELAQKKAAKKARQRKKKEEDRIKAEEEQKRLEEEIKKKEAEKKKELARKQAEQEKSKAAAEAAAVQALKDLKKRSKKERQAEKRRLLKIDDKTNVVEETIPAMVTIKRIAESGSSTPTVTITLKGSTPDQDKLLYTLVNGSDDANTKPKEQQELKPASKKKKKKQKQQQEQQQSTKINNEPPSPKPPQVVTKELKVTVALDMNKNQHPANTPVVNQKPAKPNSNHVADKKPPKQNLQKADLSREDLPIPMLRLPPGITITKVEGPVSNRNYPANNAADQKGSSINVSKSGVIVVDTEKLVQQKQDPVQTKLSKSAKKKKNKKKQSDPSIIAAPNDLKKMVTLKNPVFQSLHHKPEPFIDRNSESCGPAAIFTNENGMVTIRSSRLQQSLSNGGNMDSSLNPLPLSSISNLLPDIQKSPTNAGIPMPSELDKKADAISSFNAQEILSGLPGIEITKVDKRNVKIEPEVKKTCQTAQLSIIPASNGGDKFNLDKDDWLYDSVFTPRDVLEDDMDAEELELEAFKRFCQQSIPPKRKEKVAHLNVADIVVKKKTDVNFV